MSDAYHRLRTASRLSDAEGELDAAVAELERLASLTPAQRRAGLEVVWARLGEDYQRGRRTHAMAEATGQPVLVALAEGQQATRRRLQDLIAVLLASA